MEGSLRPNGPGALVAREIGRSFGATHVLDDVSMELGPGVVAVVGANGSGKTTLLRIFAGVLDPDAGEARLAGAKPGEGTTGFAPSGDRMLNWRLTGRRNLEFFARIGGLARDEVQRATLAAAEALDATELLQRRAGECSTGQRRRLMLARAFLSGPPVVLLDEPFEDLDETGCAAVERACRGWADAGGLVMYAAPSGTGGPQADAVFRLVEGKLEPAT